MGERDAVYAHKFMNDLKSRLANRVQITTDGHHLYLTAVGDAFGSEVDYAMIVKMYGQQPECDKRYSPAECVATKKQVLQGNPDTSKISTNSN